MICTKCDYGSGRIYSVLKWYSIPCPDCDGTGKVEDVEKEGEEWTS